MNVDGSPARVFHSDPEILGGTPVFIGTRVPVATLTEWLEGGYALAEFLDNFPTVRREQAVAFLRLYGDGNGQSLAPNLPPG